MMFLASWRLHHRIRQVARSSTTRSTASRRSSGAARSRRFTCLVASTRIPKRTCRRRPPRQLFRYQTLAELARAADTVDAAGVETTPSPRPQTPERGDQALDPAAFPEADLTQEELDDVFAELGIESDEG